MIYKCAVFNEDGKECWSDGEVMACEEEDAAIEVVRRYDMEDRPLSGGSSVIVVVENYYDCEKMRFRVHAEETVEYFADEIDEGNDNEHNE